MLFDLLFYLSLYATHLRHLCPADSSLCGAPATINITEAGQVPCSSDNVRPPSEFITRIYCDTYALCDGNTFKVSAEPLSSLRQTVIHETLIYFPQ